VTIEVPFDGLCCVSSLRPRPRPRDVLAKPVHGLVDLIAGESLGARDSRRFSLFARATIRTRHHRAVKNSKIDRPLDIEAAFGQQCSINIATAGALPQPAKCHRQLDSTFERRPRQAAGASANPEALLICSKRLQCGRFASKSRNQPIAAAAAPMWRSLQSVQMLKLTILCQQFALLVEPTVAFRRTNRPRDIE